MLYHRLRSVGLGGTIRRTVPGRAGWQSSPTRNQGHCVAQMVTQWSFSLMVSESSSKLAGHAVVFQCNT